MLSLLSRYQTFLYLQAGLLASLLFPIIQGNPVLRATIIVASLGLLLWLAVIHLVNKQPLKIDIYLRKQHYIQAMVQASVFLYWGYYWRTVYEHFPLILVQLLFAYGFDMLLSWTRRRSYTFGFGAFPIVFSINLFLLFKPDWFYLQLVMIAVGLLGKEFVRWQRDGKSVHIFNPSAFALGLFSLLLIVTKTTDLTWGPEIASTLTLAPNIYLFLFLVGLVVMYFFSITLVAMTAAATLFVLSGIYFQATGVPYFIDSEIPAAVFLGLHLLITDPSTSPRSLTGKAVFGVAYGVGVFSLYALLTYAGAPTFYDKLLCVPLLNLCVIAIDKWVARLNINRQVNLPKFNLMFMGGWIVLFAGMGMLGKMDGFHLGDSVPFWQQACEEGRRNACDRLRLVEENFCRDGSAWACNDLGLRLRESDPTLSRELMSRACQLRFTPACENLLSQESNSVGQPKTLDLRLLLREGGLNLMQTEEAELWSRACKHGWVLACAGVAGQ